MKFTGWPFANNLDSLDRVWLLRKCYGSTGPGAKGWETNTEHDWWSFFFALSTEDSDLLYGVPPYRQRHRDKGAS